MSPTARALAAVLALAPPAGWSGAGASPGAPPGESRQAPAASNAPSAPPQSGRDYDSPPPGSRADQELWKAAHEANNQVGLVRHTAARLQLRAKTGEYDERLGQIASRGPEAARRAEDLKRRLRAAWSESVDLLVRQWPVDPTRACRYPLLNFEGVMFADEGPQKKAQLAGARYDLEECLARARIALRAADRSNGEFEAVLAEADRELGVSAPAVGPGAPGASPGQPQPKGVAR